MAMAVTADLVTAIPIIMVIRIIGVGTIGHTGGNLSLLLIHYVKFFDLVPVEPAERFQTASYLMPPNPVN